MEEALSILLLISFNQVLCDPDTMMRYNEAIIVHPDILISSNSPGTLMT